MRSDDNYIIMILMSFNDNISLSHYLPGVYAVVGVQVRQTECVLHARGSLHPDHGGAHARLIYCKIKRGLEIKSYHDSPATTMLISNITS